MFGSDERVLRGGGSTIVVTAVLNARSAGCVVTDGTGLTDDAMYEAAIEVIIWGEAYVSVARCGARHMITAILESMMGGCRFAVWSGKCACDFPHRMQAG